MPPLKGAALTAVCLPCSIGISLTQNEGRPQKLLLGKASSSVRRTKIFPCSMIMDSPEKPGVVVAAGSLNAARYSL